MSILNYSPTRCIIKMVVYPNVTYDMCLPRTHTEEHAGLCVRGGRPSDMAHHESAAESQTLLHPQAAGSHKDQLHTK